jgi:ATP-binding protein involved in chromosome partitioning
MPKSEKKLVKFYVEWCTSSWFLASAFCFPPTAHCLLLSAYCLPPSPFRLPSAVYFLIDCLGMPQRLHPQDVMKALATVKDARQQKDIVTLGLVKDIEVSENVVTLTIALPQPSHPASQQIIENARKAVRTLGVGEVQVRVTAQHGAAAGQASELIPNVKNTIAVASGKGGVGKSTVAVNLAVALERTGAKVGLMDTDVYGPSVPILMGSQSGPTVVEGKLEPPVEHGIKLISMAYFLPEGEAVIWRGPMLHKTIHQFLGDVRWGELDYLVIDMPPGTGDIQLSLSQTIPLTGAVIVSTPQDMALTVASKAIAMFQKLSVPILGIVENMSYYTCPHCGAREDIFGHGGARNAAQRMQFAFLGEIPLDVNIRCKSDAGRPVADDDSTEYGKAFRNVAHALARQIDLAREQPPQQIVIE